MNSVGRFFSRIGDCHKNNFSLHSKCLWHFFSKRWKDYLCFPLVFNIFDIEMVFYSILCKINFISV